MRAIPNRKKTKKRGDIFNGNVRNPGGFIFVYIVVSALLIIALIFSIFLYFSDHSPKAFSEVRIISYEVKNKDLFLTAEGDSLKYYVKNYRKVISDPDGFLEKCSGNFVFKIGYFEDEYRGETYRRAVTINRVNGDEYIAPESVEKQEKRERITVFLLFVFLIFIWIIFIVISIRIGRHPEKYSRKNSRP